MQRFSLVVGCLALFCAAAQSMAATIPFSDSPLAAAKEASLGVLVDPTGPTNVDQADGGWEVLGATSPFRNGADISKFYSGTATFDQPRGQITLDVQRANNSGWRNLVTFTAFDEGKKVASQTVDLKPLGDASRITLAAPAIDSVQWGGEGWIFHPYYVTGLELDAAAVRSVGSGIPTPTEGSPAVGSPVPEPATSVAFVFLTLPMFCRRHRKFGSN